MVNAIPLSVQLRGIHIRGLNIQQDLLSVLPVILSLHAPVRLNYAGKAAGAICFLE